MRQDIADPARRDFVRVAAAMAATLVAGGTAGRALAASAAGASPTALGPIRQIDAGVINIGYVDMGPRGGAPVLLFHGWPYDIHAFAEVAPLLVAQGHRVIIPHLRGHGSTIFRDAATPRNAQQAALGADGIALMDALGIRQAVVAGFDWGARTADIMAVLWPERCKALVPGSQCQAAAAGRGTAMVVSILFRDGARQGRLCRQHQRLQQADLAIGVAALVV